MDWYYFPVMLSLLITGIAQLRVNSAYRKYSNVLSGCGLTGAEMARRMLTAARLSDVEIEETSGHLTDHYDPRVKKLRLSQQVYQGRSLAALGVAAHEAGHALQDGEDYAFLSMRSALVPAANIGSNLAWPLFLMGLIFSWDPLMLAGIAVYTFAVVFTLITLPVEFDASRRAMDALEASGGLTAAELSGARSVLRAAAMTYVAAAFTAILQLLRLVVLRGRKRN